MFSSEDAAWLANLLEKHRVEFYVDGGWGVDALLGEQTRPHGDIDIAAPHSQAAKIRDLLAKAGFSEMPRKDAGEHNFVMGDGRREVVVRSYELNPDGTNKLGAAYEARHLTGRGTIAGRAVKCLAPDACIDFRTRDLPLSEDDWHAVKLLAAKFHLPLPEEYDEFEGEEDEDWPEFI